MAMATDKRVTLLSLAGDELYAVLRNGLIELGFTVTERVCPRSTSDWVPFPVLLLSSGSGYYGCEAIEGFLKRVREAKDDG